MRELADTSRIRAVMRGLGHSAIQPGQVFLAGGATAVLLGWRGSTVDVDRKLVPEQDSVLRAIPALKESLHVNIELATPDDFIPVSAGWQARSPFVAQEGRLTFRHFDLSAQALAKIERGHARDLADVNEMLARGLVDRERLRQEFAAVEPHLYRYPAIDPSAFRRALTAALGE